MPLDNYSFVSRIDPTKPEYQQAYTSDVRQNFAYAKEEIEALRFDLATEIDSSVDQADMDTMLALYLPLVGGIMQGQIDQPLAPINNNHLTNKLYVDTKVNTIASGYLPLTGGNITGNLSVTGTLNVTGVTTLGTLNANTGAFTGAVTGGTSAVFGGQITASNLQTVKMQMIGGATGFLQSIGGRLVVQSPSTFSTTITPVGFAGANDLVVIQQRLDINPFILGTPAQVSGHHQGIRVNVASDNIVSNDGVWYLNVAGNIGALPWLAGENLSTTGNRRNSGGNIYTNNNTGICGPTPPAGTGTASDGVVSWTYVASDFVSNRVGIQSFLNVRSKTGPDTPISQHQWIGVSGTISGSANQGGTDPTNPSLTRGTIYGLSSQTWLYPGATAWTALMGAEIDAGVFNGGDRLVASVKSRWGINVASYGEDQGVIDDAALIFPSRGTPWGMFLQIGEGAMQINGGINKQQSTNAIIRYQPRPPGSILPTDTYLNPRSYHGIDLHNIRFETSALRGPSNSGIDTLGGLVSGAASIKTTQNAVEIDAPGYISNGVTWGNTVNAFRVNDELYDPNGSGLITRVLTIDGAGKPLTLTDDPANGGRRGGILTTPPANPMLMWGGSGATIGSPGGVNVTWKRIDTINIGSTGASIVNIGKVGGTTNILGTVNLPATATGPFLPLTGGTVSGNLTVTGVAIFNKTNLAVTVGTNTTGSVFQLNGATTSASPLEFAVAGIKRFHIQTDGQSNLQHYTYDSVGANPISYLKVTNTTGEVLFSTPATFNGNPFRISYPAINWTNNEASLFVASPISLAGNYATNPYLYTWNVPSDVATSTTARVAIGHSNFTYHYGGAGHSGGRTGITVALVQAGITDASGPSPGEGSYAGGRFWVDHYYPSGGTSHPTNIGGFVYAGNAKVHLHQGALYYGSYNGSFEVDMGIEGSTKRLTFVGPTGATDIHNITFTSASIPGSPLTVTINGQTGDNTVKVAARAYAAIVNNDVLNKANIGASYGSTTNPIYGNPTLSSLMLVYAPWTNLVVTVSSTGTGTITLGTETIGASSNNKLGSQFLLDDSDGIRGFNPGSCVFDIHSGFYGGTAGSWESIIGINTIGGQGGRWPLAPFGTIIGINPQVNNPASSANSPVAVMPMRLFSGIDLRLVNFSKSLGFAYLSPGYSVSYDGTTRIGGATITPTNTGIDISPNGWVASAVTINAPGGAAPLSYFSGDIGNVGDGQLEVITVNNVGGVATFNILVPPTAPPGAAPNGTAVPVIGGSGSGWTVNITWIAATTINIGKAGGTVNLLGVVNLPTTVTGAFLPLTGGILTGPLTINGTTGITISGTSIATTNTGNTNLDLKVGGTGGLLRVQNSNSANLLFVQGTSLPVNRLNLIASNTGGNLSIQANGSDTDISINLAAKGLGIINYQSRALFQNISQTASTVWATGGFDNVRSSIYIAQTHTGTATTGTAAILNRLSVNDSIDADPQASNAWKFIGSFNPGATGQRQFINIELFTSGVMSPLFGPIVGHNLSVDLRFTHGGTGLTNATAKGGGFGYCTYLTVQPGATNLVHVTGHEYDIQVMEPTGVYQKQGIQIVSTANDAGPGWANSTAYMVAGQTGAYGFRDTFQVARWGATWPIEVTPVTPTWPLGETSVLRAYTPYLYATRPAKAKHGINLAEAEFTRSALQFRGFRVHGSEFNTGAVQIGQAILQMVSNNLSIDTPGRRGVSAVVASGGANYVSGDVFYDPYGGVWSGVITAGALVSVTPIVEPLITGAAPANPVPLNVSLTGNWGTGATINITWTAGGSIDIGHAGGTVNIIGTPIIGGSTGPFLPLTGGTVTGNVTITGNHTVTGTTTNNGAATFNATATFNLSPIHITGSAGSFRTLRFETGGLGRFSLGLNSAAEGGANVGSDFVMTSFNDAGVALNNNFLTISRLTGRITLATPNAGITTSAGTMGATFGAGNTNGYYQQSNFAGAITYSPLMAFNQWTVASDTMAYTGQQMFLHGIFYNWGGAGYSGNRGGLLINLTQTGVGTGLSPQGGQVCAQFMATANNTLGGSPGSENGGLWGINVYNKLTAAARNVDTVYGIEIDVESALGSTYLNQIGVAAIATNTHKQAPIVSTLAFGVGGQTNTIGFDVGYQFNNWGLQANSTVMRAEMLADNTTFNISRGIDFRPVTFSNDAFAVGSFAVNPTGRLRVGAGYIDSVSTGLSLDTGAIICTGGTLTATVTTAYPLGSNNYWFEDIYGGIWTAITGGSGSTNITGITQFKVGYAQGPAPTNPITLTPRGLLKKFAPGEATANLTWDLTRTTISIGSTNATVVNIGRAGQTVNINGNLGTTLPYLSLAGGTVAGNVTINGALNATSIGATTPGTGVFTNATINTLLTLGSNTVAPTVNYNGPAGSNRYIRWQTAGLSRWQMYANGTAEGGGNAGTDFVLASYDDAGNSIGNVLLISRANRNVAFYGGISFSGGLASATNDLTKHILFTTNYGINISSGRLNIVNSGATWFVVGSTGVDYATINTAGATFGADASTAAIGLILNNNGSGIRNIALRTAGINRWQLQTGTTETGTGDVGCDLSLNRYSDAGTSLGTAFTITRSSGLFTHFFGVSFSNIAAAGTNIDNTRHIILHTTNGNGINNTATRINYVAGTTAISHNFLVNAIDKLTIATAAISATVPIQTTAGLGVFGTTAPASKPTISGSRGSALATIVNDMLNALANMGILVNATTA